MGLRLPPSDSIPFAVHTYHETLNSYVMTTQEMMDMEAGDAQQRRRSVRVWCVRVMCERMMCESDVWENDV